jgi:hypothetical protein
MKSLNLLLPVGWEGGEREAKVLSLDIACSLRSPGPPRVFKSGGINMNEESQDNHKGFI